LGIEVQGRSAGDPSADRAFLKLVGSDGERFSSSTTVAEDLGWSEIYGWTHGILSPFDAASGLPTGEHRHQLLVVSKPIDEASPRLMAALLDHEVLGEWRLEVWRRTTPAGPGHVPPVADLVGMPRDAAIAAYIQRLEESRIKARCRYSIELTNARVAGIETKMLDTSDGEDVYLEPGELVSFTYEEIAWVWGSGKGEIRARSRWARADSTAF